MSKTRWEVPWAVKQSTRERVAALPRTAQELLGVVAVIGQRASAAVLAAGAEQSEAETITGLEIACQAGLLVEDPERGQTERYRFAHDLIRDVVEADLSVGRQTLLHSRVAAALEQRLRQSGAAGQANHLNDRTLAQVAYHYAHTDMPDQEARYLRLAGDHARRVYAHQEAAQHYQELIACLDRLQMRREAAQARKDLAVEFARVGRFTEAVATLAQAGDIYQALGDVESLALVARWSAAAPTWLARGGKRWLACIAPRGGVSPSRSPCEARRPPRSRRRPMAGNSGALSDLSFMAGTTRTRCRPRSSPWMSRRRPRICAPRCGTPTSVWRPVRAGSHLPKRPSF